MDRREEVIRIFPGGIRAMLKKLDVDFGQVREIRLRAGEPLLLITGNREVCLTSDGRIARDMAGAYQVSARDIRETLEYMSSYSLYAFEEEIRQGFLTIPGGHRVGLSGKTVMEGDGIRTMKFISSLNVRLAHQVPGCADEVLPYLYEDRRLLDTLILSPPRCGKTTLLRDLIRQISDGTKWHRGMTVGVVDERSEIGACYQGMLQNDLGTRTDVLDCCPKALGMMMLVRSMAPEVIAVDEIGGTEEMKAVAYAMNCGCTMLATVHGASWEEIEKKPGFAEMAAQRRFRRYVTLDARGGAGHVRSICDRDGKPVAATWK
ncbi:MAG: stage III sporulation protein AA [Clostridiales bacterium]|nr:stage III sporulation protein AA [Clostridiales bacterium]